MKQIHCFLISLALLTLASCAGDDSGGDPPRGEKTITFTLSSSASSQTGVTRGVTRADLTDNVAGEDAVNRLDVFFYTSDGEDCLFYPVDAQVGFTAGPASEPQTLTVSIPDDVYATLEGEEMIVYVVANAPGTSAQRREAFEGKSLEELKETEVLNSAAMSFNVTAAAGTETPPADFLMTGQSDGTVEVDGDAQLGGTIPLTRAAAKIVVNITNASITGYTPQATRVRITNYLDNTILDSEEGGVEDADDYLSNGWRTLRERASESDPQSNPYPYYMDPANSLYTYSNDWSGENIERETYITLEIEWFKQEDESTKLYYYRIPFSYIGIDDPEAAASNSDRIRRNFVYLFDVDVTMLGGLDPEAAVDLEANFDVIDWSTRDLEVSIQAFDYLYVANPVATTSQGTHTWEYFSSVALEDVPALRWIVSAGCEEYTFNGRTQEVETDDVDYVRNPGARPDGENPLSVSLSSDPVTGRTFLNVDAWEPVNYVPLEIVVRLVNGEGLSVDTHLTIEPSKYVTASYSDGGTNSSEDYPQAGAYISPTGNNDNNDQFGSNAPDISSGIRNWYFYEITTKILEEQSIRIDDDTFAMTVGDPTMASTNPFFGNNTPNDWDDAEYIVTDPDKQNIVSPRFVMASRRGMVGTLSWERAWERCRRYREAQYPAGTWRMPTYAELALISMMQNDDESAIKDLLSDSSNATTWWTALENFAITPNNYDSYNEVVNQTNTNRNVRCVRDTWKTYPQDNLGAYAND
jgi:hypothetical protein